MVQPITLDLGDLADPTRHNGVLDVSGQDESWLQAALRIMLIIRMAEERIGDMVAAGNIACPCHLGIGQEAVAAGVSVHLRSTDRVFGAHRSHSHYLALGGDVLALFAEVLGRATGCSKGMGGSMHLYDAQNGFLGSVPIVAGTIPLAVGAGLAAKLDGRGDVAVSYFGDGAAEEGALHESLNLASNFKLPTLFVCENNLFASHLHIGLRQPANAIARYAHAHGVCYEIVDGNDVVAVATATARLTERMRDGEGPGFLEAVTYRWRGHVGPREDIDVGVNRSGDDLRQWKKRDPIGRLADAMMDAGWMSADDYRCLWGEVAELIERAWREAEQAPYPEPSALLKLVYADQG